MAQKTSWTGAALTETDINLYLMGEGGAWSTYSPVLTQSGTVTATVTRATYARYGRTIHFQVVLVVTGTGSANNQVTVSLPVTAASSGFTIIGGGYITDASAGPGNYAGLTYLASTTTAGLQSTSGTALGLLGFSGTAFTAALSNTDGISIAGTYEAAS